MKQILVLLSLFFFGCHTNKKECRLEFRPEISFDVQESNLEKELAAAHLYVFPDEKFEIIYNAEHIISQKIDSTFTLTEQFIEYHSELSMLVVEPSFADSNLYDCIYYPNKFDDGTFLLFENSTKIIQYK